MSGTAPAPPSQATRVRRQASSVDWVNYINRPVNTEIRAQPQATSDDGGTPTNARGSATPTVYEPALTRPVGSYRVSSLDSDEQMALGASDTGAARVINAPTDDGDAASSKAVNPKVQATSSEAVKAVVRPVVSRTSEDGGASVVKQPKAQAQSTTVNETGAARAVHTSANSATDRPVDTAIRAQPTTESGATSAANEGVVSRPVDSSIRGDAGATSAQISQPSVQSVATDQYADESQSVVASARASVVSSEATRRTSEADEQQGDSSQAAQTSAQAAAYFSTTGNGNSSSRGQSTQASSGIAASSSGAAASDGADLVTEPSESLAFARVSEMPSTSASSASDGSSGSSGSVARSTAKPSSSSNVGVSSASSPQTTGTSEVAATANVAKEAGFLSGGEIAGVVIAVLAAVLALIFFCCWMARRRRRRRDSRQVQVQQSSWTTVEDEKDGFLQHSRQPGSGSWHSIAASGAAGADSWRSGTPPLGVMTQARHRQPTVATTPDRFVRMQTESPVLASRWAPGSPSKGSRQQEQRPLIGDEEAAYSAAEAADAGQWAEAVLATDALERLTPGSPTITTHEHTATSAESSVLPYDGVAASVRRRSSLDDLVEEASGLASDMGSTHHWHNPQRTPKSVHSARFGATDENQSAGSCYTGEESSAVQHKQPRTRMSSASAQHYSDVSGAFAEDPLQEIRRIDQQHATLYKELGGDWRTPEVPAQERLDSDPFEDCSSTTSGTYIVPAQRESMMAPVYEVDDHEHTPSTARRQPSGSSSLFSGQSFRRSTRAGGARARLAAMVASHGARSGSASTAMQTAPECEGSYDSSPFYSAQERSTMG